MGPGPLLSPLPRRTPCAGSTGPQHQGTAAGINPATGRPEGPGPGSPLPTSPAPHQVLVEADEPRLPVVVEHQDGVDHPGGGPGRAGGTTGAAAAAASAQETPRPPRKRGGGRCSGRPPGPGGLSPGGSAGKPCGPEQPGPGRGQRAAPGPGTGGRGTFRAALERCPGGDAAALPPPRPGAPGAGLLHRGLCRALRDSDSHRGRQEVRHTFLAARTGAGHGQVWSRAAAVPAARPARNALPTPAPTPPPRPLPACAARGSSSRRATAAARCHTAAEREGVRAGRRSRSAAGHALS